MNFAETAAIPDLSLIRDLSKVAPGTVLRSRTVVAAYINVVPLPLKTYQLLYRTADSHDQPLVTVTTVVVPPNAHPEKLVLFGSPEDSAASMCAPSYSSE